MAPAPAAAAPRARWLAVFAACGLVLTGGAVLLLRPGAPHAATPVPVPTPTPAPAPAPTLHVLHITSEPSGVEVLVGDKPIGQTPLEHSFEHGTSATLTLQGPGLEPVQHALQVNGDAELPFKLQRKKAALILTSKPSGATVSRDGQSLGVTPLRFTGDAEVPVKLVLTLKGYNSKHVEIIPRDGEDQAFELVRPSARGDLPFKTKGERRGASWPCFSC